MDRVGRLLTSTMSNKGFGRELALGLLVTALLAYSWMFKGISVPNERTRVYLAVSLVDYETISIDRAVGRFGTTTDIAMFGGKFYTDKAPGSSLLGAAVYGVARIFTRADDWTVEGLINLMRTWLMIPIGLLGFFVLRRLLEDRGVEKGVRDLISLGWILGTSAFHYSTAYYGHQIVALSFLIILLLLLKAPGQGRTVRQSAVPYYAGAGAAAGLAGLTEYQSAIPCLLILAYVVATNPRRPSAIIAFCLAALPFAVLLLAYNWAAFGGPFELSYEHLVVQNIKSMHSKGIGGVSVPHAEAVFGSLLSLHRGLITTSPIFLLAPHGLYLMWKSRERWLSLLLSVTFLYYLLFVFSAEVWWAGWGFGPRLVVPAMAWMMLPISRSVQHLGRSWVGTGVVTGFVLLALLYHQSVHLVFPELPEAAQNPLLDLVFPAFSKAQLSPNIAVQLTGHPGLLSALPLATLTITAAFLILRAGILSRLKPGKRAFSSLIAVSMIIPLMLAVFLAGPKWSKKRTQKFIDWMSNMEKIELAPEKGKSSSDD